MRDLIIKLNYANLGIKTPHGLLHAKDLLRTLTLFALSTLYNLEQDENPSLFFIDEQMNSDFEKIRNNPRQHFEEIFQRTELSRYIPHYIGLVEDGLRRGINHGYINVIDVYINEIYGNIVIKRIRDAEM